jgi:predicted nucleotidyltransferase
MTLDDVRRLIEPEKDALRAKGVAALYVFGSVARGEAGAGSDVDVLIDIEPGRRFHIIDLANVYNRLTAALGTEVDIVTSRSIKNALQGRVLEGAVRVY